MREMKDCGIEWIGDIPVSWDTIKLKFYGKIYNGSTPKSDNPEYYDGDITWVTPADMDNASTIINSKKTITEAGLESCGTNLVPKNSIVISTRAPIGVVCIAGKELCTNQGCKSIVPKDISCAKYPYYFLLTQSDTLNMLGKGTTFLELSTSDLSNYKIPFPAKKEQQAIADYLDGECARIDGIVTTQRQIIEKLKEYKKSVITEAVTRGLNPDVPMKDSGIDWIGKIPEYWEISKLKYYSKYITDGTHTTPEYLADGVPFLSIKDISAGKLDFSNTKYISQQQHEELSKHAPIEKGDILFTRIGTLGVSVIVETDIAFDIFVSVGLLKPRDNINTKYLNYVMNSEYYYQYIQLVKAGEGTSAAKFNLSDVSNSPIVCPLLSEQQAIADYLDRKCSEIDSIIEKRERMIELMTEYKKSLIYECVTGKKEIVDVVE